MNTPVKFAMPRHCIRVCLLVAAFASDSLSGQASIARDDSTQRPAVNVAALDAATAELLEQRRQRTLEKQRLDGRSASARAAIGSVALAVRCVQGYVVDGSHRASASDVMNIVAERLDCDAGGCRAYQVTAARDSNEPFDLDVSVTCS